MNFEEILKKILEIARYPEEERADFIKVFNKYLFSRLFDDIKEIDEAASQALFNAAARENANPQDINLALEEISQNTKVKERIGTTVKDVIGELVDDIAKAATEEEKQKILTFLPS